MADINNIASAPEDPKAARAKLKADKKEYQKKLKEQRKEQKEKAQEFADRTAEINGDNAGGLATIVLTFFIILIWLAIMALLVKLDVGGFGSDILAPLIRDIKAISWILPEDSLKKPNTEEAISDYSSEGSSGGLNTLEDANAYIKRLEQALQSEMEQNSSYASSIEKLQAEVARLEPFEKQQKDFYDERASFYNSIIYGENVPDAAAFASYYEMIDPENAARIYRQLKQQELDEEAIRAFAQTYSGMKAKQCAKIFDEMVTENQIELVSRILAQMSIENRGDVLAAMEKPNAAKLTQLLEPNALEQKSTKVTGDNK
jgi:flagellar motility protein MotE (MotC chaperone)